MRGRPSGTYFLVRQKVCKDRSKGFPLCKPPHGRFVSGRRAAPCQCGLSPLFSKKWLYGRGSTHGCFRLKMHTAALLHVAFGRFCCGYVNLCQRSEIASGTNGQTLCQRDVIDFLVGSPVGLSFMHDRFLEESGSRLHALGAFVGVGSTPRG